MPGQWEREAFDALRDCKKGVDAFASRQVGCVHQISLCGAKRLERPTFTSTLRRRSMDGDQRFSAGCLSF